jgi:hypothetical protein
MKPDEEKLSPRQTHGLKVLKRAVKTLGRRLIDRRTSIGKALAQWQAELVADLGGRAAISTQEKALVELCVRTKLMLDSIDHWLLQQPRLVNIRKQSLLPVVIQRTTLANALSQYLGQLGLTRRAKPTATLADYLAGKDTTTSTRPLAERYDDGVREDQPPHQP